MDDVLCRLDQILVTLQCFEYKPEVVIHVQLPYVLMQVVAPQGFRAHSLISSHPTSSALRVKPAGHEHSYEPSVSVQVCWQPPFSTSHSLTFSHVVPFSGWMSHSLMVQRQIVPSSSVWKHHSSPEMSVVVVRPESPADGQNAVESMIEVLILLRPVKSFAKKQFSFRVCKVNKSIQLYYAQ